MTAGRRCSHIDHRGKRCMRSFHWTGGHVYEPIPKIGRAKIRTAMDEELFRTFVAERADGMCEAAFLIKPSGGYVCEGRDHVGEHAHHIVSRARGGGHDPDNGMFLCAGAHRFTHDHPKDAEALGLLRTKETA